MLYSLYDIGSDAAGREIPNGKYHSPTVYKRKSEKYIRKLRSSTFPKYMNRESWLYDNLSLVERELKESAKRFSAKGSKLRGIKRGKGRIYAAELINSYIVYSNGQVDLHRLKNFLAGCTSVREFEEQELELIKPFIVFSLITFLFDDDGSIEAEKKAENVIKSLFVIKKTDFDRLTDSVSATEKIFNSEKSGTYRKMTRESKKKYRAEAEKEARRRKLSESEYCTALVERANGIDVGFELFEHDRERREERAAIYSKLCFVIPCALFFAIAALCGFFTALILLPLIMDGSSRVLSKYSAFGITPHYLPEIDYTHRISDDARTVCAITALIKDSKDISQASRKLEEYFIAEGKKENLYFALLADYIFEKPPEESELRALSSTAEEEFSRLNEKYGSYFIYLSRKPLYDEKEGLYIGKERKRGAILSLAEQICEGKSDLLMHGADFPEAVAYMIILDSDTRPFPGALTHLIGKAAHPMNRAQIDEDEGRVTKGHGIIMPAIKLRAESASKNTFSEVYGGRGGWSGYDSGSAELSGDLFCRSAFTGKGIIDAKAFYYCLKDRFPENHILSHDVLEGGVLRAGRAGDLLFFESFPSFLLSYHKRTHRWIRGDIQNIPWLFPKVKNRTGETVKNPIELLTRCRLAENVGRAYLPTAYLASLILLMRFGIPALLLFIYTFLSPIMFLLDISAKRGNFFPSFFTVKNYGMRACVMRSVYELAFLPYTVYVTLDAIVRAVCRMCISKKKQLEWSVGARVGEGIADHIIAIAPVSAIAAVLIMLSSGNVFGVAVALLWFFAPFISYSIGKNGSCSDSAKSKEYFIKAAIDNAEYYLGACRSEWGFLPADNYQESPYKGYAERTSPTNIGFFLISAMSVKELGAVTGDVLLSRAISSLDTLQKLEKFKGHLYNWYDLSRLIPLFPKSISTVDSGNLCACLIVFAAYLREIGEAEAATKAERLAENMQFGFLYKKKEGLFAISYECVNEMLSENNYDLLASEARIASYIAIARGEVPVAHWQKLSRPLTEYSRCIGLLSWSGTAFEYLMPDIFMPSYPGSLLAESGQFAVLMQRLEGKKRGAVWGVSESAIFSFDRNMNYSYRANGTPKLALSETAKEYTVSPYSTFLAVWADEAEENLKREEQIGLRGDFGFYEACEISEERGNVVIRSYMAHHVGMSIASVFNAVSDGIRKRFMSDARMSAFSALLEEQSPEEPIIIGKPEKREQKNKPDKAEQENALNVVGYNIADMRANILEGGDYSLYCSSTGKTRAVFKRLLCYSYSPEPEGAPGFYVYLEDKVKNEGFSLTPSPCFEESASYEEYFTTNEVLYKAKNKNINTEMTVTLPNGLDGELRRIVIFNGTDGDGSGTTGTTKLGMSVCLEPVLTKEKDYESHKAFSRLFIRTEEKDGVYYFIRRNREGEDELFARLAFRGAKFKQTERGDYRRYREFVSDIEVDRGKTKEIEIMFTVGKTLPTADFYDIADITGVNSYNRYKLKASGLDRHGYLEACAMAVKLLEKHGGYEANEAQELQSSEKAAVSSLWKYGISGDLPIICAEAENEKDIHDLIPVISQHDFLSSCGIKSDFVFIISEGGNYLRPREKNITAILSTMSLQGLINVEGGYFIIERSRMSRGDCELLYRLSAIFLSRESRNKAGERITVKNKSMLYTHPKHRVKRTLSVILCNENFGTIATDRGLDLTWHKNARLGRLTEWKNEQYSVEESENLFFKVGSTEYSLSNFKVEFLPGKAVYSLDDDNISISIDVFIPKDVDMRYMNINYKSKQGNPITLTWAIEPIIGESGATERFTYSKTDGRIFTFKNPLYSDKTILFFTSSLKPDAYTCDKLSYLSGEMKPATGEGLLNYFAAQYILNGEGAITLACGAGEGGEVRSVDIDGSHRIAEEHNRNMQVFNEALSVDIPDYRELERFCNRFLLYQVVYCRIYARCSIYQCGGAFGFRDQLQDACAVAPYFPELLRKQIVNAARHQYTEGDVTHWWHEWTGSETGIRSRCSDDYLWLPYSVLTYRDIKGNSILDERASYLLAEPLRPDEQDRYSTLEQSGEEGSVYEHSIKALDLFVKRGNGIHGLPLMLGGDWNDGMNDVGGESVWLAFFASMILKSFSYLCTERGDVERGRIYLSESEALSAAAYSAWDGEWFLRGYYKDGLKLGSRENHECSIDSIAQSFALFALGRNEKTLRALKSAYALLFDKSKGVIKLFTPPFSGGTQRPGYIRGYPAGVRENGGQYTHASVWLAMAMFDAGLIKEGLELTNALLPENHDLSLYEAESFVLAADINEEGRAGWSWYTGSAGWFLRLVTEKIIGIKFKEGSFSIFPLKDEIMDGAVIRLRFGDCRYTISFKKAEDNGECDECGVEIYFDGEKHENRFTPIDGESHDIVIKI